MRCPKSVTAAVGGLLAVLGGSACERRGEPETVSSARPAASAPSPARSPSAALEPCKLLTDDEASAVLGRPATGTPSEKVTYASSCIWTSRTPLRGLQVMTSTSAQLAADDKLQKIDGASVEKRYTQLIRTQLGQGTAVPVNGLGDGALWAESSQQLWIMKKDQALITISLHGDAPVPDALDKCKAVAGKVLARL